MGSPMQLLSCEGGVCLGGRDAELGAPWENSEAQQGPSRCPTVDFVVGLVEKPPATPGGWFLCGERWAKNIEEPARHGNAACWDTTRCCMEYFCFTFSFFCAYGFSV